MPIATIGSEFITNGDTAGDQLAPHVIALADGRYVVSWYYSYSPSYLGWRLFNADGSLSGDQGGGIQYNNDVEVFPPVMAALPDGSIAVMSLAGGISLNVYSGDGVANASNSGTPDISDATLESIEWSSLAADSTGRVLMVGHKDGVIWGQYWTADGLVVGDTFQIYDDSTNDTTVVGNLEVLALAGGGFQLVWTHDWSHIWGPSSVATALVSGTTTATLHSSYMYAEDAIALRGGGYAILVNPDPSLPDTLRLIGERDGQSFSFDLETTFAQGHVIELADGRFLVCGPGVDGEPALQLFNPDGSAASVAMSLTTHTDGEQYYPTLAQLADGNVVVTWATHDVDGGDGDGSGIVTRIFDPSTYYGTSLAEEYYGGNLADQIYGGADKDTLYGGDGNDVIAGDGGEDRLYGGGGDDTVLGGEGIDELYGGTGKDVLRGGAGNDGIYVRVGDDVAGEIYDGGQGSNNLIIGYNDTASFAIDLSDDTVVGFGAVGLSYLTTGTASVTFTAAQASSIGMFFGSLSASASDTVTILMGASTTFNGSIRNFFNLSDSGDKVVITGDSDAETITGPTTFPVRTSIDGGGGNDTITTGNANDTLIGGAGSDTLDGGGGADTFVIRDGDAVAGENYSGGDTTENNTLLLTGTDGSYSVDVRTLDILNIPTLRFGAANGTTGGTASATITGMFSTVEIDSAATGLAVTLNIDVAGNTSVDYSGLTLTGFTGSNRIVRILGTGASETVVGTGASDHFFVNGDGIMVAGPDHLTGGNGDDQYFIGSTASTVIEVNGTTGGIDTVHSSITHTLTDVDVENLVLGNANIDATGNASANKITGGNGNNVLTGLGGIDTLTGLAGDDTYVLASDDDIVVEASNAGTDTITSTKNRDLSNYANVENLTLLTGASTGTGNTLANKIVGNSGVNTLKGLAGNDTIDGAGGVDRLEGGDGSDTYTVDLAGDVVVEATAAIATGGNDLVTFVGTTGTFILGANVERLTLGGTSAIHGTGNTLANTLIGNSAGNILKGLAGNDTIDGAGGVDTMEGGDGSDTYIANLATDVVTETNAVIGTGGNDLVVFTGTSGNFILGANVERLTLGGTAAISGRGNTLGNTLIGNAGANTLNGMTGKDTMTGGLGADKFVFTTALGAANIDTIIDFNRTQGDKIQLDNAVMAALGAATGALGAKFYAANGAANGLDANDFVVYNTATGALYYDSNANAAGGLTQIAVLSNKFVLNATDFEVI